MLLSVKAKNFLSYGGEVTFDMYPNPKKTLLKSHIYTDTKIPVLKQAAIYGPNGSGKSNLLRAVSFIRSFASNKDFINEIDISKYVFRLTDEIDNVINLAINFLKDDKVFHYEIFISETSIKEKLEHKKYNELEFSTLFSRNDNELSFSDKIDVSEEVSGIINRTLTKNSTSSFLYLYNDVSFITNKEIDSAFNWINNELRVYPLHRDARDIIKEFNDNSELNNFAQRVISKVDLGVNELFVKTTNFADSSQSKEDEDFIQNLFNTQDKYTRNLVKFENNKPTFLVQEENDKLVIKELMFKHVGKDKYIGDLEMIFQSDGTITFLNLICILFKLINNPITIFLDEIENSIHPYLICNLINFFGLEQTKGQLIFTTHETELLDQKKYLRHDEVWFTEKNNGSTDIYSLNEFKEHNTINIKNGYLQGRYGSIPRIEKIIDFIDD